MVVGRLTLWPAAAREIWAYKSLWQSPRRDLLAPGGCGAYKLLWWSLRGGLRHWGEKVL